MKSRLASRAHSFKENFLHVFGGHASGAASDVHLLTSETAGDRLDSTLASTASAGSNSTHQVRKKSGHRGPGPSTYDKSMSKKTNSTDNIIDFVTTSSNTIADPRSTEVFTNTALRLIMPLSFHEYFYKF